MRKIIDLLIKRFTNDWMPLKAFEAIWKVNSNGVLQRQDTAMYEIQYSAVRDKYRIKCWGYKPKLHSYYTVVVDIYYKIVYNHTEAGLALDAANEILAK